MITAEEALRNLRFPVSEHIFNVIMEKIEKTMESDVCCSCDFDIESPEFSRTAYKYAVDKLKELGYKVDFRQSGSTTFTVSADWSDAR